MEMQILSRAIYCPSPDAVINLTLPTLQPPMRRLSASRPLLSSVASGLPRWWPPALARRRDAPAVAAPNLPALRIFRFPHGSRNMANSSGVQGVESIYRYGRGCPAGGH
ncbi:hypothetical protein ACP70R_007245 [Stipagrostis hirtigluma subsp. patula]